MRDMPNAKRLTLILRARARLICLTALVIIIFAACLGMTACYATTASASQSQQRFSWVDDSRNVAVGTDSETGVEYLLITTTRGVAVTPIVDKSGDIYRP